MPILAVSHSLRAIGLKLLGRMGQASGLFLFYLHFRRSIVFSNLRLALGAELDEREIHSLARKIYRNIGITFLEIARNFSLSRQEMQNSLQLSEVDKQYIQSCLDRGRGIVFISAHIANWELLAMGLAVHGFPAAIVVKKMTSRISQFLIERQRLKTGLEVIYPGGTIERMRSILKKGRIVGFMVDQNTTGKKGIRVNFFGVPASSIRGLSSLVKDTGAAVIPICAFREPDGTHRVKILPELSYLTDDSPESLLREEWLNTQQYQAAIETLIRMRPEQWLWIHRRWKADRKPIQFETAHLENRE